MSELPVNASMLSDSELKAAIRTGAVPSYPLEADDVHILPSQIRGRTCEHPKPGHFTAYVNAHGRLRVDHTGDLAFWLEVDMSKIMRGYLAHKNGDK